MKHLLSIFFFLLITIVVFPQSEFKKTATSGFVFLELPVNARNAGLGEVNTVLSDVGAAGIFTNPAALGFTDKTHSFSASYAPWLADINQFSAAYAINTPMGVFAVGAVAVDYGSMPKTQKIPGQKVYEIIGDFSSSALSVGVSYSRMLTDRFSFGVSAKYVRESIDIYAADNIVFDGGMLYYTGFHTLRIGAAMQNFGVESKYINDAFKMPLVLKLGLATELFSDMDSEHRFTIMAEALHPNNNDEKVHAGFEYCWNKMLSVRLGYKFLYDEDSYSFGVGFNPQGTLPVSVDFAYSDFGRLGNVLRFSLNVAVL